MNPTHSLRWRIQLWHGALLLVVLSGLGLAAYRYERAAALRRVDVELRERVALLMEALPREPGRPPRPHPGDDSLFAPLDPPPRDRRGPPTPGEFRLPAVLAAHFDQRPGSAYYVLWRRDGKVWTKSPGAPADAPMPRRPAPGEPIAIDRTRGLLREAFGFTPPGECILVGRSVQPELTALQKHARLLFAVGTAVWLVGLGGGWWLASRAIKPLDTITATASRIADGRLSERIDVAETDSELGQLAAVLNSTFSRLEATFAQQARFTADAAHELRTPVSVILSQVQMGLRGERSAEEYREVLEACLRAARRMQKLTQSLLELARHDAKAIELKREPCDLAAIARETAALVEPLTSERQLTVTLDLQEARCRADADRVAQVLLNLLTNAIEHTPAGGRISIRTGSDGTRAIAVVTDNGAGIPAEHLERIFDRFHRVDDSRNRRTGGAGLGLAICREIASAHDGALHVESEAGRGSTFTVSLPAESEPAPEKSEATE